MMYSNNFAAAIKVNGKILREFGETVYLPFGSEYEIRLKNLNTTRAKVNVEIDGENVTSGGIILRSMETFDLERFIRNGNLKEGNRFKFIERTSKIENHRGIQLEDGLIQISYEFEKPQEVLRPLIYQEKPYTKTIYRNIDPNIIGSTVSMNCSSYSVQASSIPQTETGITVEGSKSNQSFSTTHWRGSIAGSYTLIFKLLGETEANKAILEPVTVKTKLECKTCGTINPATSKFCSECGTALEIV